jgi:glycosyltransferase involved in cell wall biosynthesis
MARIAMVHDIAGVAAVQAELLRKAGHDVEQIPLPSQGASWKWPAKALAIPVRIAAFLPTIRRLRRGRYDVVHIHFLSQGIVGVLAGVPFFAQAHGSDLHANLGNPAYRRITRMVAERARAVFYVTPNLRPYLERYTSKLVYLPNPVELDPGAPPASVNRILIFTRLHPVKGPERIFPAAERLSALAHVTAFDYGPLAPSYVRDYSRWVEFVKPIPHEHVGGFLREFDVVIGQMRQGVLGLMEIEALASGRPVIAGVDSSLYRADPPPVINASGPDEIVAALKKLRDDPAQLREISRRSAEWAKRNHGYSRHLALLEATYFQEGSEATVRA